MARIDKINQQVKREVGRIIQEELSDPRLQFVTITEADVSKDLRNARISFSVLGDMSQIHAAQQALDRAKGMVRRLLGQRVELRYLPDLFFVYDQSIEMSARIEETLKEIKNENDADSQGIQEA